MRLFTLSGGYKPESYNFFQDKCNHLCIMKTKQEKPVCTTRAWEVLEIMYNQMPCIDTMAHFINKETWIVPKSTGSLSVLKTHYVEKHGEDLSLSSVTSNNQNNERWEQNNHQSKELKPKTHVILRTFKLLNDLTFLTKKERINLRRPPPTAYMFNQKIHCNRFDSTLREVTSQKIHGEDLSLNWKYMSSSELISS